MTKNLIYYARKLRKNSTEAEKMVWNKLRSRQFFGIKFRRQEPIGKYIVDYVSFDKKIIVEIDGSQHISNESDIIRDKWLLSQGFQIFRFFNNDVLNNINGVLLKIEEYLETHPPLTPPIKGGE